MPRQMTNRGYDFLEQEEGERLHAYDDATGRPVPVGGAVVGVLTIGVGHTGPDVVPGMVITQEESRRLFDKDTDWAEACVEKATEKGPRPNDNEFDAMVSLAFNIGAAGFAGSSVARMWNAGDRKAAANAFALWNRDKFGVNEVLVGRRAREMAMFLTPLPSEVPKPMPQAVEAPAGATTNRTWRATVGAVAPPAAVILIENAAPAIEAINNATTTIEQAHSAWSKLREALGLFANGHVLTFLMMLVILGATAYIAGRIWKRVRNGEVRA